MTSYHIEENNENTILTFRQETPSQGALIVLRVLVFISFIFPILALINIGLEVATLVASTIFVAIGIYFLRLYYWNLKGKEIITINDKEIIQSFDYGITVDLITSLENKNIQIGFMKDEEVIIKGDFDNILDLDVNLMDNTQETNLVFKDENSEHILVKAKISQPQSEEIISLISKRINLNN